MVNWCNMQINILLNILNMQINILLKYPLVFGVAGLIGAVGVAQTEEAEAVYQCNLLHSLFKI
ncbi:hypothetical protein D8Z77_01865 [Brevibacillus laterosporus]|nr:hypothetical protein D8Z77_01865 [Brevibacillus laterosporus]